MYLRACSSHLEPEDSGTLSLDRFPIAPLLLQIQCDKTLRRAVVSYVKNEHNRTKLNFDVKNMILYTTFSSAVKFTYVVQYSTRMKYHLSEELAINKILGIRVFCRYKYTLKYI